MFSEQEEPVSYEVDGDVFVAAARFDDLDALFAQAERVGASVFQLMYVQALTWWRQMAVTPSMLQLLS